MRILFLALFFLFLSVKDIKILGAFLIILVVFNILVDRNIKELVRAFKAIILFNLGVSGGYVIMARIKGIEYWDYLAYINLKVLLLTYFVFYFFSKVNILKFFAFSKDLSYLLTITLSQIYSYKKSFIDFKDAYKARVFSKKDYQFIKKTFKYFFKKAINDSEEKTLAMKARGFFE